MRVGRRFAGVATIALGVLVGLGGCSAIPGQRTEQPTVRVAVGQFVAIERAGPALPPALAQGDAERAARDKLAELDGSVTGLALTRAHFAPGLQAIADDAGSPVYESTEPADGWVLVFEAPPQGGYETVRGLVIVDASTGEVSSVQVLQSN